MAFPFLPIVIVAAAFAAVSGKKRSDPEGGGTTEPPRPDGEGEGAQTIDPSTLPQAPRPPEPPHLHDDFNDLYPETVRRCWLEFGAFALPSKILICVLDRVFPDYQWPPPAHNKAQWVFNVWYNRRLRDYIESHRVHQG